MKAITIANQKGGVGKTTTTHALATGLLNRGYKVLVIDMDPQQNMSFTSGIDTINLKSSIYEVLKGESSTLQAIQKAKAGYDILPASLELSGADMEFTQPGREYLLAESIEPIKKNYDFILMDTPPTLGILTINALTASNSLIVPMGADVYSLQGLSQLQKLIENVQKHCNNDLKIEGLLLTKYSPRAVINRQLKDTLEEVAKKLHTKLFNTQIREAVAIKEVQFTQGNLFKEHPTANITRDYESFIDELIEEGR